MNNDAPTPRRWQVHVPAMLILGSPIVAAGMMLSVALADIFLMPRQTAVLTIGVTLMVPINGLLAVLGAAIGALRVDGTPSTRLAVLIASVVFAAAVYLVVFYAAEEFLPGFERYGP